MEYLARCIAAFVLATSIAGCATSKNHPQDPFEGFNRAMFDFNDGLDRTVLRPTAEGYREIVPEPVQFAVGNFFENLGDVWTAVNNFLQGNPEDGISDVIRFAVNSTFGIAGLIDIGSEAGLPKHKQDFGATLGVWGIDAGPYLVLPFLGPSTVRDTAALPLDMRGDPWAYVDPADTRNIGTGLRLVDKRAALLDASNLLEEAALDRYEFLRDGFLQRRAGKIDDSRPGDSNDDATTTPKQSRNGIVERESLPSGQDVAFEETEPKVSPIVEISYEQHGLSEITAISLPEPAFPEFSIYALQ